MRQKKVNSFLSLTVICVSLLASGQDRVVQATPMYSNPVIAGDFPDPSIIRTGDDYWAAATGSEWAPVFPLLHSLDLINWEKVGGIFPDAPAWADGRFWAPELSEYKGKYFAFYTGRKKGGPLCVASAVADSPVGPYRDNGPLVCQEDGSIDAFPTVDESGQRYLIWKEDGNSHDEPTLLWAQRLSEDGTKLLGQPTEILRNDPNSWEHGVVEGPYVLRRGGYFYLFYSGASCCGLKCNYGLGVARSKHLLGPYEKYDKNPLVAGNDAWKCPGHGSIVTDKKGRTFFLYHAYSSKSFIYTGREAVLDEVTWADSGWPVMNDGKGVSSRAVSPMGTVQRADRPFMDHFQGGQLQPEWQWPQSRRPVVLLSPERGGVLSLAPGRDYGDDVLGAVLATKTITSEYVASTAVLTRSLEPGTQAGLAAFGDNRNAIGASVSQDKILLWKRIAGKHEVLTTIPLVKASEIYLRYVAKSGCELQFSYGTDGKNWLSLGSTVKGGDVVPWDRSIRVAIFTGGKGTASAQFSYAQVVPEN